MLWAVLGWLGFGLFAQWLVYKKYKDQFDTTVSNLDDLIIHVILIIICGPISIIFYLMDDD